MTLQPCAEEMLSRIKSQAESRRAVIDCYIQVEDTVLIGQPKQEKLSTPYHSTLVIVTKKHHSMLTAENAAQKVTHNSSHFKKLLADDSTTFITSQFLRERELTWTPRAALLPVFRFRSRSPQTHQGTPVEMLRSWLNLCVDDQHMYLYCQRDSFKRFD